jgi:hypothetical protein
MLHLNVYIRMIALCQVVTRSLGAVYSNQRQTTQLLLHNTTTTDFETGDPAYITKFHSCINHTRLQRPTQDITHVHERGSTAKTAVSLAQPRATHSLRNDDHRRPSAPLVRVRAPIRSSNSSSLRAPTVLPYLPLLAIRTLSSFVAAERDCVCRCSGSRATFASGAIGQPCVLRQTAHCCGARVTGKKNIGHCECVVEA